MDYVYDPEHMAQITAYVQYIPPVEGKARLEFIEQAKLDFQDYAIIGDAEAEVVDGILTLRVDLRPPS